MGTAFNYWACCPFPTEDWNPLDGHVGSVNEEDPADNEDGLFLAKNINQNKMVLLTLNFDQPMVNESFKNS